MQFLAANEGIIRHYFPIVLVFLSVFGCTATPTRVMLPSTQTPVKKPLAYEQAKRLGRGVNLSALETPNWGMVIQKEYFQYIKEAGFDTIRVPIRWSAHAIEEPPYPIDETFFERVDWVIDNGLSEGLNVVINMHHYNEIYKNPEAHMERFIEMWKQIVTRYKNLPDNVYFELLNEPRGNLNAEKWNLIMADTVAAIRKIDTHHTLILTGVAWGTIKGLPLLNSPKGEDNLIITFHFYEPFLFTHQGAGWTGNSTATVGVIWPGPPETKLHPSSESSVVDSVHAWFIHYNQDSRDINPAGPEPIIKALDKAVAWSNKHATPLWMGEFGAYGKADMQSRINWTTFVREEAEGRGISWSYWEFCAGFGVYDRKVKAWNKGLLKALISSEGHDD